MMKLNLIVFSALGGQKYMLHDKEQLENIKEQHSLKKEVLVRQLG